MGRWKQWKIKLRTIKSSSDMVLALVATKARTARGARLCSHDCQRCRYLQVKGQYIDYVLRRWKTRILARKSPAGYGMHDAHERPIATYASASCILPRRFP